MQIRAALTDDIKSIAQLWHLGWHQAHAAIVDADLVRLRTAAEFVARTKARLAQTSVAVEDDGALAGFFMIEGDELYQFYVGIEQQGRGTAGAMMAAAEAAFDVPRAWLACTVGNDRAAAFYVKCGWRNVAKEPCEIETRDGARFVDVWRFEKAL